MIPSGGCGSAAAGEIAKAPRGWEVELRADWCKGCYLCVEICPVPGIFRRAEGLGPKGFKPVVVAPAGCTGCRLCELLCPDLAITVSGQDVGLGMEVGG